MAVTFTVKVHDALAASVAPVNTTLFEPATAEIDPPPQLPLSPFGVDTTNPLGSVSMKPTPLNGLVVFGLLIVTVNVVTPPVDKVAAPNVFAMVGGATT